MPVKTTTTGGIPRHCYNMAAAVAAQKVLDKGGTLAEAEKAAFNVVYDKNGNRRKEDLQAEPEPVNAAPEQEAPAPTPAPAAESDAALRRYLIAVCRAAFGGRGYFEETMSTRELLDCASVLDIPVKQYVEDQWQ